MLSKFAYPVLDFAVYDGDTVRCVIDLGWDMLKRFSCRIAGIDTPEIRTRNALHKQAGLAVTGVVTAWCKANPGLMFASTARDKYAGRAVGHLFPYGQPEHTLANWLLARHLARPYEGGRKPEWEEDELRAIIKRCVAIFEANDQTQYRK